MSFLVGIVIVLFISIRISQKTYKPIKLLKNGMEDYITHKSTDEIEELAIIFKKLTDQ